MASNTLDDIRRNAKVSLAGWALRGAGALIVTAAIIVVRANVASRSDVTELRGAVQDAQKELAAQQKRADEQAKEISETRQRLADVAVVAVDLRARLSAVPLRESDRKRAEVSAEDARKSFQNNKKQHGISVAVSVALEHELKE